jgi:mannose/cellobiose epimerase-like protein (N-acyl-D-glucosamine 2-epimerase family)
MTINSIDAISCSPEETINLLSQQAKDWLFEAAAPLWSTQGWDDKGLFAERLSFEGNQDDTSRRVFVQARHIYSFTQIGRLGWQGPWRERSNAALDYLLANGRREDGLFIHRFNSIASYD